MSIKEISTKQEIEQKVVETTKTVVIDFWDNNSGPCKVMSSVMEHFSGQYSDTVVVYKVDTTTNPSLVEEFDIQILPTIIVYKNGVEQPKRLLGAVPLSAMIKTIVDGE